MFTTKLISISILSFVMAMAESYRLDDVVNSHRWLGHDNAYTELLAVHPEYKPGKENYQWNYEHRTFPKVAYARNEKGVAEFVRKHHKHFMVCYGLNPRERILTNERGYARSSLENEMAVSKNLLFDFDFKHKDVPKEQFADFEVFLEKASEYFRDHGLNPPEKAFTGNGYHALFAYPEINVEECPDISQRLKRFSEKFSGEYARDLRSLEVKMDHVYDLRRMVKIYGTAKPDIGIVSRFYGGERKEDEALRKFLLGMKMPEPSMNSYVFSIGNELPPLFRKMLQQDARLRRLWDGEGKQDGYDQSASGYDFSLVKKLLQLGFRNLDEIASIVSNRPNSSVQKSGKSEEYVRRTIANVLMKL